MTPKYDWVNTPLRRHLAHLRLAPDEVRDIPPRLWPAIGESRFLRFTVRLPQAAAVVHGAFYRRPGERYILHGEFGAGIPSDAGGAFFQSPSPPRNLPDIQENGHFLMLSAPALSIWLAFDNEGFAHEALDFRFKSGEGPVPPMRLANVTRLCDAVDFDRSYLSVIGLRPTGDPIALRNWGPLGIRTDIPASVHMFRESSFPAAVFISRELADALTRAKIKGWKADDPADHYRLRDHLKKSH